MPVRPAHRARSRATRRPFTGPAGFSSTRQMAVLFMLINTVTWGAALPVVKPALDSITPFEFLFGRFLLAAVFSLPILAYYLWSIRHAQWRRWLPRIIGLELFGTVGALGLLYAGLARTSALEASLITSTAPIFVTIGGIFWLKEREEPREWIGLLLAFLGAGLLAIEPLLTGRNGMAEFSFVGNVLVISQNVVAAVYYLLAKRWYSEIPKLLVSTVSFYIGIVGFFLLSLLERDWNASLLWQSMATNWTETSAMIAIGYMALFGSIIGLTAYIKGQNHMEASEASLFTYLQPLVYIPLSIFLLHETTTPPMWVAVVLIACGVIVAELRPRRNS